MERRQQQDLAHLTGFVSSKKWRNYSVQRVPLATTVEAAVLKL
jgi:hypothetical protein